ncbi:MAG: Gfo/Idh/MocA family oxidoreductase [Verrucomicrobiales bacterium]|nr:Gfo/Idh/MocA family oxidoreductase [Verrucomicrobiales bacterium]MCP5558514.1 Gfo/Idh/MocA family oxidoreductase [Verrucomicrobiaceae bacterium]
MNRRNLLTSSAAASLALAMRTKAATASAYHVAIIGHTGRGNYGHGIDTMWLHIPQTQIVAVADPDATGLATELKKLKIDKGYVDYHKMLAEVKPDIVAIGPRHIDQHRDMTLAAIEAGARGIYMEKPFCRSLEEADEIAAACAQNKVKLAIAHRNRYHPVLPVVTRLLKDGAIGRVLEIRSRGKEDTRGGSLDLWVLGCHLFNLIHYFAGDPKACTASVLQDGRPITKADIKEGDEGIGPLAGNEVHARFETASGTPCFFDSIQNAGTKTAGFGVQIIGTEGIIDLRIDKEPLAQITTGSPFNPTDRPRTWVPISSAGIGIPEPIKDIRPMVAEHLYPGHDLIKAIESDGQALCNVEAARTTIEMISAVFESHRLGGQRIPFPLQTRVNPLTLLGK